MLNFDQLYQQNKTYFDNVTLYILAAQKEKRDIDRNHTTVT